MVVDATHPFPDWPAGMCQGWGPYPCMPCREPSQHIGSCARPSRLQSALGRGGSAPAASSLFAWPREALEVQSKINSLNPSDFLQSRSAGGRPMFCGSQRAFAIVPRCLCCDDCIPKTCLWCFSVPTNEI